MDYTAYEEKMKKTIAALETEFASIRAGRANASVLDRISVEYYGSMMKINEVAQISSPDPRMLTVSPYDRSLLKEIEKAIQASDLGINPQTDGKIIRLAFPPLTEERRKELVKTIDKTAEGSKVAIRAIRRDAMDAFKAQKKKSEITEDDLKIAEKDIQNLTDKYIAKIEDTTEKKTKEILSV